jgi:hypothetical protein
MAVELQDIALAAVGGRFAALFSRRDCPEINKIRGGREADSEISAEQIANLLDHRAVAEVRAGTRGLHPGETSDTDTERGELPAKHVYLVTFSSDKLEEIDQIYFDAIPVGRWTPDHFVTLFNQAARQGYCR